ncbi:hypothetical protein ACHAAC_17450, partial [Aeromicrobium sp. CF4.19]|uniref:TPR repeat region-containing protein n=1 Tax=Aeromicrobium sp. CF4.19 TaxID=3373082 RepID=UPI003EE47D47
IQLSPQEKFEAYQAAVENGTLPSVEEMTETERQAFLQENPGLLEEWMQVEEPPEELQEVIVGLALPDVDAEDADVDVQTILDGIDGNSTAEEIRAAFGNSGEVASGLALLLPWANRTGVDLGTHGRATDAQQYSQAFGQQTWDHREDIETLLTDGVEREYTTGAGTPRGEHTATRMESIFSEEEAEELRSQWAGSYLVASNEDIGGSWESLPQDMREDLTGRQSSFADVAGFLDRADSDLPAGDGLSLELANSASQFLDSSYGDRDPSPGGNDYGWSNGPHEELYGSLLERTSLNHEATTFLLGGDPGYEMDHVPEDFSSEEFITNVYTHPWDDGGQAASSLTDWTIDPPAGQEALADSAYNGLYDTIAGNQEIYDQLISMDSGPGTGQDLDEGAPPPSVGERNPELMRSLALATGVRLDEFDTATDTEGEKQRTKMLTLINSDHAQTDDGLPDPNSAAVQMAALIDQYQSQRIADSLDPDHEYPDGPHQRGTVGDDNGRLFGLNSAALRNVVFNEFTSAEDAAAEAAEIRKSALGLVGIIPVPGNGGPAVDAALWLAEQSIEPAEVSVPERIDNDLYANLDPESAGSESVQTVSRGQFLQAMIDRDPEIASDYEDLGIIDSDGNVDLTNVAIEDTTHLNNQLTERMGSEVTEEINDLVRTRNEFLTNYGNIPDREWGP